jgi:hypothetical protein
MKDNELILVNGGSNISGTLINSIAKMISTFLDLGRAIGSSIRMNYL